MSNNPLKQYFRRPAVYLKLPSGTNMYPNDVCIYPETGELPVYPMTAIDEITAKTPDALFNGSAVAELINSCVPNIKNPWKIVSTDIDAILIAIRAASGGNDMEVESTCPKCSERHTYSLNLIGILADIKYADYNKELKVGDLTFKFKPVTYTEMNQASMGQFEIGKMFQQIETLTDDQEKQQKTQETLKFITNLTMKVLTSGIEYIKTPNGDVNDFNFILEFLQNCEKGIYEKLRDYNNELRLSSEIKPLQVTCMNEECKNQYEQPFTLNTTNFFG